jgi:hypothetical protein
VVIRGDAQESNSDHARQGSLTPSVDAPKVTLDRPGTP